MATSQEDENGWEDTTKWEEQVLAAGSLPGAPKVRHKHHPFGDPDQHR